jgi:hypothetical protein
MKTIWKYKLNKTDKTQLEMPAGAEVLCFQIQRGEPVIWALVDDEAPKVVRYFWLYPTGATMHPDTTKRSYIGTCQVLGGDLVFHLFGDEE